jgi:PAS domain S-box-containing protein
LPGIENAKSGVAMAAVKTLELSPEEALFRLAAIVESSDDAIISKDLRGIITSWNKAAEIIFGYKADEMIGRSILTLIPEELQHEEPEILRKIGSGERIDHYETERVKKDGQRIWVSLTISPVRDPSGKIIGASKIARDMSERKKVQEALIQSEKLAATGRMAAAIAHEINNPLEAVTNLAYLLANDDSLNETAQLYANLLLQEVGRASEIAKQSLAFYRDSGRPAYFEVADLLDNVLTINRKRLERHLIEVVEDYRKSVPLFGYASELRQVFANLLLNAMDAVPEGGRIIVRTTVHRSSETGAPTLSVTIADTGTGITAESRKQLFQPFFTTKSNQGNGLGLWVSHGIVEKHGGRIQVKSSTKPGTSGTVFRVLLPVEEKEVRHSTVA